MSSRVRAETSRRSVEVEELAVDRGRLVGQLFWGTTGDFDLTTAELDIALFCGAHVVHADGGDGFDPGVYLGGADHETAAELTGLVVVESWWYRIRDTEHAVNGLRRSGASCGVEVWCTAPETIIRERYRQHSRHTIHCDRERLNTDWEGWATNAGPLSITPVLTVDIATDVPIIALVEDVVSALSASCLLPAGFTGSTA
ncbi:hypothetical protein ACXPWS_12005 [Mycobacterium sp. BMJ-28]